MSDIPTIIQKKFVIEADLKRRHLTDFQKAELGHLLEPIERELAKRRMSEAGKIGVEIREGRVESNEPTLTEMGKTTDIVAKKVSLSPTTYQSAKTIIEKAAEELKEKVLSGETSINYAYKQIKRAEGKSNPVKSCSRRYVAAGMKQLHTV